MDRPMQAMVISGEKSKTEILARHRHGAIRFGFRSYIAGAPLMIGCPILCWCAQRTVISVDYKLFKDIEQFDFLCAGHVNAKEALIFFASRYADVTEMSPMTVVRWE